MINFDHTAPLVLLRMFDAHVTWIREENCWRSALKLTFDELHLIAGCFEHRIRQTSFFSFQKSVANRILFNKLGNSEDRLLDIVHVYLI